MIGELRILLVRCYGSGGERKLALRHEKDFFFLMAKPKKPTGNSPPSNRTQEGERLGDQLWATFRKLLPEYREVIKKLAACKGMPLKSFYEDMLNRSMLKLSEHRIGTPRKLANGTEYIQVGYANIAGLLLSRFKDENRWLTFQNTLLRRQLREYWGHEFLDNAIGNEELNWMIKASGFGLPVTPHLFDSDKEGLKEDRDLIRKAKHAEKFIGRQLSNDQRDKYTAIDQGLRENKETAKPKRKSEVIRHVVKTRRDIFRPEDDPEKLRKSFDLYVKRHPNFLSSVR